MNKPIVLPKHAEQRLKQRRKVKHMQRHINKLNSWGFGQNGVFLHKGWRYVICEGVVVTVYGGKELKELCRQRREDR